MRRRIATLVVTAALALGVSALPASAHVHGVTPLPCHGQASPNAGAAVPFGNVPADPLNGPGPIIPLNAGGTVTDGGGQHSSLC